MSYALNAGLFYNLELEGKTLQNEAAEVEAEEHTEATAIFVNVPNATVDMAISIGGLTTVKILAIISDQPVTFKVNGAAVGIQTRLLLMVEAAVTSLTVSNNSGFAAALRVLMAGA